MLEIQEFLAAKEVLEKWVGVLADPWADFRAIDDDGSGSISFDEFCDWAIKKNLDLDQEPTQDNSPRDSEEGKKSDMSQSLVEATNMSEVDDEEYELDDGL